MSLCRAKICHVAVCCVVGEAPTEMSARQGRKNRPAYARTRTLKVDGIFHRQRFAFLEFDDIKTPRLILPLATDPQMPGMC